MEKNKQRSGFIKLPSVPVNGGSKSILPVQDVRFGLIPRQETMPVRIQIPNGYNVETFVAGVVELADIFGILKCL
jgi:hypothetical protein